MDTGRYDRMYGFSTVREWIEKRSGPVFVIAGCLLFVAATLDAVTVVTGASISNDVSAATGVGGLILTYAGLLALYPRLAERAPRLARVGVLLVSLPGISFFAFLAKILLAQFVPVPSLSPVLGVVFGAVFFLFAVGVSVYGIVCLRTDVLSNRIGILLLVLAAPWFWLLGWILLFGFPISDWAVVVQFGTMAVAALNVGYLLQVTDEPANLADPTPSSSA